jgi:hypothetical protein
MGLETELAALESAGDRAGIRDSLWAVDGIDAEHLDTPHPYAATCVVFTTDSQMGGPGGVFKAPIEGRLWLDLWRAADAAIRASEVEHHRFVTGFSVAPEHPSNLDLQTGSW